MPNRREALLILNALQEELSFSKVQKCIQTFGSPESIFEQSVSALSKVTTPKVAASITQWKEKFDLKAEIKQIEQKKVSVVTHEDPAFPPALLNISTPPLLLYCQGKILPQDAQAIGIVGSRQATVYGTKTTLTLAQQLGHRGWTIVSGLAWGIDTHAHLGALQAQARTLAVIGQGLGTPLFPPDNEALAEKIKENGAVLSEFPMNFAPVPRNFPRRNRIISGMSQAVLVVEAARRSGAFITADFALEQGKPVLAVPGPIDSKVSEGPNRLIQQGAKCVTGIEDILEELNNEEAAEKMALPSLSSDEKSIWEKLSNEAIQLEQLIDLTGLDAIKTNLALFTLEIKSLVKPLPGQYYVKLP